MPPVAAPALTAAKRLARNTPGLRGIDFGYAYRGGVITDQPCIRFHVVRKRPLAELALSQVLPTQILDQQVDVVEAGYRLHAADPRAQQPVLSPGLSIGNVNTFETGTAGLLVRSADLDDAIYVLSNWHVLAGGPEAKPGDQISQPGPMHLGDNPAHPVATLDRLLAPDEQLDAALARVLPDTATDPRIFQIGVAPTAVADPQLGAVLEKSGAVSGVTRAVVDGVGGTYQLDYSSFGLGQLWMRGFRLVKDPAAASTTLSEAGDSGALWIDPQTNQAVGLHFAGEDDASPLNDYALAQPIGEVLHRLNVQLLV